MHFLTTDRVVNAVSMRGQMSSSGLQKLSLKCPASQVTRVSDARYNLGDTAGSDPARLDAAPGDSVRGRLRLFLGYALGFGKSFRMFDEARLPKKRGQDVVASESGESDSFAKPVFVPC